MKFFKIGAALAATILVTAFLVGRVWEYRDAPTGNFVSGGRCDQPVDASEPRCAGHRDSAQTAADAARATREKAGADDVVAGEEPTETPTASEAASTTPSRLTELSTALVDSLDLAPPPTPRTNQPLKVAFIGDQGNSPAAHAVLRMIKAQGADTPKATARAMRSASV